MEEEPVRRIVRVLSNNAVLARDGENEMVLVGRGIGFGRSDGDVIDEGSIQHRYIEVDPERVQILNWIAALGTNAVEEIAQAVDLAADTLGNLHPAVYVLLLDHITFAVQRVLAGEEIDNPLTAQIRQMYPDEFDAARLAVGWLNTHLDVELPDDEAGFIALHLNAARTGETVKQPLQRANELARLVDELARLLSVEDARVKDAIMRDVVVVSKSLRAGSRRRNDAQHSIRRDLAQDHAIASSIVCRMLRVGSLPKQAEGEAAFLTVQVHGWRQENLLVAGRDPTRQDAGPPASQGPEPTTSPQQLNDRYGRANGRDTER